MTKEKVSSRRKKSQMAEIWRRMRKNTAAMIGLAILAVILLVAIFAGVICDYDTQVIAQNMAQRLQPPSAEHWFGTDAYGRDTFARVVYGARISLAIGVAATVGSVLISGFLGAVCGYYGGKVDAVIMRIMDMFLAIPTELLALAIVASLGPSMANLLIAVTVARIPPFTRIVRSSILSVIDQEYIEAARACGASDFIIIVRHVLPNALDPIIVDATMTISSMLLSAAGLSFIGMGVSPPSPEWGAMLNYAQGYFRTNPHTAIFPGIAIALTALSINLVGDGLRDVLDPKAIK